MIIQTKNQAGFSANILVLVLVVLLVITGVGYAVFKSSSKDTAKSQQKDTDTAQQIPKPSTDETANWKTVTSLDGGFTIKAPEGWELFNYPGGTINGDEITHTPGKPAIIHEESRSYVGDQKKFNVVLSANAYDAPQWQSPNNNGKETNSEYSIGSVKGKKYTIEWLESVTGVTKGDRIYQHVFNLADGRQLNVVYKATANTDNLKLIEQVIQTIKVN